MELKRTILAAEGLKDVALVQVRRSFPSHDFQLKGNWECICHELSESESTAKKVPQLKRYPKLIGEWQGQVK